MSLEAVNGRVSGYTIIEVTVAMVVAALVVAVAYTAFHVVGKQYQGFQNKNRKLADYLMGNRILVKDFSAAGIILRTSDGLTFKSDTGSIQYKFEERYILRNQFKLRTDTLFIASEGRLFTFRDRTALASELVDHLEMRTEVDGHILRLHFRKNYSAQELFLNEKENSLLPSVQNSGPL